jgi:hypothetical protein
MANRVNSSGRQYSGITRANEDDEAGPSEEMGGPVIRPGDLREDITATADATLARKDADQNVAGSKRTMQR